MQKVDEKYIPIGTTMNIMVRYVKTEVGGLSDGVIE